MGIPFSLIARHPERGWRGYNYTIDASRSPLINPGTGGRKTEQGKSGAGLKSYQ